MKIKKILNNSALSAYDEKGNEVILIGRGISFNKHPNDEVDTSKIEKVFTKESTKMRELKEVMDTIPELSLIHISLGMAVRLWNSFHSQRIPLSPIRECFC